MSDNFLAFLSFLLGGCGLSKTILSMYNQENEVGGVTAWIMISTNIKRNISGRGGMSGIGSVNKYIHATSRTNRRLFVCGN